MLYKLYSFEIVLLVTGCQMYRENRKCTSFCINYFHASAIVDLCKFPILKFYRFIAQLLYSKLTLIFCQYYSSFLFACASESYIIRLLFNFQYLENTV